MTGIEPCPRCGTPLSAKSLQGLCPKCLVTSSLAADSEDFGDYELLEEIAHGGMGIVYKARQISLNRLVAVKMILSGQFASEESKTRFRTEARAAANLNHPNIVQVHEVGQQDGFEFFSMDYVQGESLATITRERPLAIQKAARLVKKIAEAIQHAHERGILHRDLKPSNILIDSEGEPHVTDFGLAKIINEKPGPTLEGQVLGSPSFLPPEQADAKMGSIGPWSDVYALGAILYHLLTGRPPFMADTVKESITQVLTRDPVSPRLLVPSIPKDLETICLKCMQKEPPRRYQSGSELAEELERFLSGKPIRARPIGRAERCVRWGRRQPMAAALLGAIVIAVIAGTSLVTWQWRRAESNAEDSRRLLYVKDMQIAFEGLKDGELASVLSALRRQVPTPGQSDLRGFEWRYLWWRCHHDVTQCIPARPAVAGGLTFSPDGDVLAAYYWDNVLQWWDPGSQKQVRPPVADATELGGFLADQSYVFGEGDTIKISHAKSGELIRTIPQAGELVAVAGIAGKAVAIDSERHLRVYDIKSGRLEFKAQGEVVRRSDFEWNAMVAISPDGQFVAVGIPGGTAIDSVRNDSKVELWKIGAVSPTVRRVKAGIYCLAFGPESRTLAVGRGDGKIDLWNVITGETSSLAGHVLPVLALTFSHDGQLLASGSSDETIQLWDLAINQAKPHLFDRPVGDVWSLAFSPDDKRLAIGTRNEPVVVVNLETKPIPDSTDELATNDWAGFVFSPNSRLMAAACKGGIAKVWDVLTFRVVGTLNNVHYVVAFSPDGKNLLVSNSEKNAQWWNLDSDTLKPLPGRSMDGVACADLSPDRTLGALGYEDGTIMIIRIDSGEKIRSWQAHDGKVVSVKFSPKGNKVLSGGRDRSLTVWDISRPVRNPTESSAEHRGAVCALAFSPNEDLIASGCGADMIKLWKPSDLRKALKSMPYHKAAVRTLCFSPNGKTLASGSADNKLRLIHVDSKLEIGTIKMNSPIRLTGFSPDGNILAIVTDSGTLKLLRTASFEEAARAF